ncbi:hypothetical protein V5H41_29765, partial [Salmonella enterica]
YMPSGSIFGVTLQLPSAPTVIVCFKTPDLTYRQDGIHAIRQYIRRHTPVAISANRNRLF